MKLAFHASAIISAFALAMPVKAQDVMSVAKDHYKVLVNNENVRVVENTLKPGEKDLWHTHPAGWYIVTRPGRMKVVFASGKDLMWTPKAGESGWSEAEDAHTSENVGTETMSYILVEIKSAAKLAQASGRK